MRNFFMETSLKSLKDLHQKKTSEEIALHICNPLFDIDKCVKKSLDTNELDPITIQLIEIIEKALECNSMNAFLNELFLLKFTNSEFLNKYVYELIAKKPTNYSDYLKFIRSVLTVCYLSLIINPQLIKNIETILERLDFVIKYRLNNSELLNEYQQGVVKLCEKSKKKLNFSTMNQENVDEDFTEMSITPKVKDIFSTRAPLLKKNKINEPYKDVRDYLDTQFKLLREDFLQPLRLGVGKFREIIRGANIKKNEKLNEQIKYNLSRIDSLNVYFDTRMESNTCTDQGVVYTMKLNWSNRKYINWETSKRLIFGSLVCFSSDYFASECLIGTICNRDSYKIMNCGKFDVMFNYDPFDLANNRANFPCTTKNYVMLETTAFFESYKHVLHALVSFQHSPEHEFPFKENLVECKNKIMERPNYLKNVIIDFRPLVDKNKIQIEDKITGYSKYVFSKDVSYAQNCSISNVASWPNADQTGLDESQYNAIRLALENKLALIQGPPGTGKTYIGVKLVELLVHNRNLWWDRPNDRKRPILMICLTNHAIDQFLEYCVDVCKLDKGVVRVGSRCKNENLNPFLLSNIKRNKRYNPDVQNAIKNEQNNLRMLQASLQSSTSLMLDLNEGSGIVSFNSIKKYINQDHLKQLVGHNEKLNNIENRSSNDYSLLEWLGVFDIEFEKFSLNDLASNFSKMGLVENSSNERNNTKIQYYDTDNQYLNNERMLEEDFMINIQSEPLEFRKKSSSFINYQEISDMIYYFNEINDLDETTNENTAYIIKSRNNVRQNQNNLEILNIKDHFENLKLRSSSLNAEQTDSDNIWRINLNQRFALYSSWVEQLKNDKFQEIQDLSNKYNQSTVILKEIRMQQDRSIMENALIIAMTTSGSSRYHNILKDIGPRIVIVEEAAEVFEAHIVSSLSKHCEHLVLIGDHVQLRPNPTVYSLAIDYKLDVSLFERLINNDTKRVMLNCQHRMRPEISVLMKHFYDKPIENHSSVYKFESIKGIHKDIFFINHDKLERRLNDSLSKSNQFEAQYLIKLCQYLIKQGYQQSQITVLTMYLGQSSELRNLLRSANLIEIRVSTVDNFQGEENDIILLSLVRSNNYGKIGFLNIHNRVCVSLSRARKGFYCIGNLDFISKHSDKWADIVKSLEEWDSIGDALKLTCNIHKENDIMASVPEDFDRRPDGGCTLKCNFQLECGHVCPKYCHGTNDPEHLEYKCMKQCKKFVQKCGHKCTQVCSHIDDCTICKVKIEKVVEECGHKISINCDTEPTKFLCYTPCDFTLKCGHQCQKTCSDHLIENDHTMKCNIPMKIESDCKHKSVINTVCSAPKWMSEKNCPKPCGEILECGHACKQTCGSCFNGKIHMDCSVLIEREFPCGHKSKVECSKRFLPCVKGCLFKCPHKISDIGCTEPIYKCNKKCKNNCYHYKCTKQCHELCDRLPCNKACINKLKCGHQCIGICGEPCPRLCRVCHKSKVTKPFFGNEKNDGAKFVYLLDCKHIIESSGMDDWIKSNFSDQNNKNQFRLPECPKCKKPIKYNIRYTNLIKKQLNEIEAIKIVEYGDPNENKIEQDKLLEEIEKFIGDKDLVASNEKEFDFKFTDSIHFELFSGFMTKNELTGYRHTWYLYLEFFYLNELKKSNNNKITEPEQINHLDYELRKLKRFLLNETETRVVLNFSEQKFYNILSEIRRVKFVFNYYALINEKDNSPKFREESGYLFRALKIFLIDSLSKLDNFKENIIKDYFEKIEKLKNGIKPEKQDKSPFKVKSPKIEPLIKAFTKIDTSKSKQNASCKPM